MTFCAVRSVVQHKKPGGGGSVTMVLSVTVVCLLTQIFGSIFNNFDNFHTGKYSDQSELPGSIKDRNSFCVSDRVDSEFPADTSGDSLPNVKGRLQERIFSEKTLGQKIGLRVNYR